MARLDEPDEVGRDQPGALVDQLVVRVLAVGARRAPDDRPGVVGDPLAVEADRLAVALHVQLLQVVGQRAEIGAVGQHGRRLRAEEVDVPDAEQTHDHRQVALERGLPQMLVDRVKAGEHVSEIGRANRNHQRKPNSGIVGVAPADPIPEAEHIVGIDAEGLHPFGVGGDRDEVTLHRRFAERVDQPAAAGVGIRQRLHGGEGLAADDEERLRRVEIAQRLVGVVAVDVADEPAFDLRGPEVAQRLVGHGGPEVAAADPDVDDGRDALAGRAGPLAAAHPVGEVRHPVQHLVHIGHDVMAVGDDLLAARRSQRDVQNRTVFGDVDVLAGEHRVDPLAQPGPLGERDQQPNRLVGHAGAWSSPGTGPRLRASGACRDPGRRRRARADAPCRSDS